MDSELIRDEDGALLRDLVRQVRTALAAGQATELHQIIEDLHEADLADLIENLNSDDRARFIEIIGTDLKPAALSELDEAVRDEVVEAIPNEQLADAVRELDSDDAVYILENLKERDKSDILAQLPEGDRATLQRSLDFPEDSAGRLMQADVIAVPPFWSVGQTIDYMRDTEDLPDNFSELYVVAPNFHLLGMVPLSKLLRTPRPVKIEEILTSDAQPVSAFEDQEDVARRFERYNLMSAPVVDNNDRLVGVVTVDDVVDVIQEEAQEDIHALGGVRDEVLSDSVMRITRGRFTWLLINLATAILASMVIALFDATIEQMVALAVLMPIVASMGGNAATQTMTVAVRALATRDLGSVNAARVITREALVGLMNGVLFAVVMGLVALLWFGNAELGVVIAAAMACNMLVAGLVGILIPITLDRYHIDPAVASGVFVTAVTDVVGFFSFLGFAAIWLV